MLDWSENIQVFLDVERGKSGGFRDRRVDTSDEDEVSSGYLVGRDEVPGDGSSKLKTASEADHLSPRFTYPQLFNCGLHHIFLVFR